MPLTLHHLGLSQSERIVWLLEELSLPYTLVTHARDPKSHLSPPSLLSIHPAGTAPVLLDTPLDSSAPTTLIAESGAIVSYIIHVHASGRLALPPTSPDYATYLTWFHFSNGTLQPMISRSMLLARAVPVSTDGHPNRILAFQDAKLRTALSLIEAQLHETKAYLVGEELTAADIMTVFSLTTMRGFYPVDLGAYPGILEYLQRVGQREAYKRAMEQGDPGLEPMLGATVEKFFEF